jgi:enoyl-[acyl-carrier protein] reductase I
MLTGKHGLIFGMRNAKSLAWNVAKSWHDAGARVSFSIEDEKFSRPHIDRLTSDWGYKPLVVKCDLSQDDSIHAAFEAVENVPGGLHSVMHAVAFAPANAIKGRFSEIDRQEFQKTFDISVFSLIAVSRHASRLMMLSGGGSIQTLSYLGSSSVVPGYGAMGPAKAALEASVRYLAHDLVSI